MAAPKAPVLGGTKKEVSLEESVFGVEIKPQARCGNHLNIEIGDG